jgi:hypothetical protein
MTTWMEAARGLTDEETDYVAGGTRGSLSPPPSGSLTVSKSSGPDPTDLNWINFGAWCGNSFCYSLGGFEF